MGTENNKSLSLSKKQTGISLGKHQSVSLKEKSDIVNTNTCTDHHPHMRLSPSYSNNGYLTTIGENSVLRVQRNYHQMNDIFLIPYVLIEKSVHFVPSLWMLLTLHHLHLLPQGHPKPSGGGLCQEPPGVFISWFSRNTVLWLLLMLLQRDRQ